MHRSINNFFLTTVLPNREIFLHLYSPAEEAEANGEDHKNHNN